MKKAVIFDIDGTLADITHRLHHIKGYDDTHENRVKKDWDAFNEECHLDTIKSNIQKLFHLYKDAGFFMIVVTGRKENVMQKTIDWLTKHEINFHTLHMRAQEDMRSDWEVKEDILLNKILPNLEVEIVVDDRQGVVDMWRRNGLTCLQCQKGDY